MTIIDPRKRQLSTALFFLCAATQPGCFGGGGGAHPGTDTEPAYGDGAAPDGGDGADFADPSGTDDSVVSDSDPGPQPGDAEPCPSGSQVDGQGVCVSICSGTTCGGHGSCSVADGAPVCTCGPGYAGPACAECAPQYQDNDGDGTCELSCAASGLDCGIYGACSDSAGAAACQCVFGHAGRACEGCARGFRTAEGAGSCVPEAAPVSATTPTPFSDAIAFLYTGPSAIQQEVRDGAIDLERVAVLRGRVMTRDDLPLADVVLSVLDRPELGWTKSRDDGQFDLVVNGGGRVVVEYSKAGFLPSQRAIVPPWKDYAWLPDVALVSLDATATAIESAGGSAETQVARGSLVADADGTRQATLLFAAGTRATMTLPDGEVRELESATVRATEYTVGNAGPAAMPGELPPTSGYTYAVELSVDEALEADASDIRFSKPVAFYVDNFLGFPVGGIVPAGYYDRKAGAWKPSENGRVIAVLGEENGLASLDIDGDGMAEDAVALAELGIDDAERARLVGLYAAGVSLWRTPVAHFTPWDCNWPFGPPDDATAWTEKLEDDDPIDESCTQSGSVIECENQTLGESIHVTGTSLSLHYNSGRVPGRRQSLRIPVSGPRVPASLEAIHLEIRVAGRLFKESFGPAPNQTHTFEWDRRDAYGRLVNQRQTVSVRVGYEYTLVYKTPEDFERSFAMPSGVEMEGQEGNRTFILWRESQKTIGGWSASIADLGGWTLSAHHVYDHKDGILYLGTGAVESTRALEPVIETHAQTERGTNLVAGADGSLYYSGDQKVWRIARDGQSSVVAGTGRAGFSGDGEQATIAQVDDPRGLAVASDGNLYIADRGNHRIRRVAPDGIISTVAGGGALEDYDYFAEEIPALDAYLPSPVDVALLPDGALLIADSISSRIRLVTLDGILVTYAARSLQDLGLQGLSSVAAAADGSVFLTDYDRAIGISASGALRLYSTLYTCPYGSTMPWMCPDPDLRVTVSPEGSVFVKASTFNSRSILKLTPANEWQTVAGTAGQGTLLEGGPATRGRVVPTDVAVGPDGSVFILDTAYAIRRVRPTQAKPALTADEYVVPAADGSVFFIFDGSGRHLRTLDAMTRAVLHEFEYDPEGRLVAIVHDGGRTTTIERDTSGRPTALVAPYGQRTLLGFDDNGYLAGVTNPAGDTVALSHSRDGLLLGMRDAQGGEHSYEYDEGGRLTLDAGPGGLVKTLALSPNASGFEVSVTTGMGRKTSYLVERPSSSEMRRTVTSPSGTQDVSVRRADGTAVFYAADGTTTTESSRPDARFGMLAPVRSTTTRTPAGLTRVVSQSQQVLWDAGPPVDFATLTRRTEVNGRVSTSVYTAACRELRTESAAGRVTTTAFDDMGRVARVTVPGALPWEYAYDSEGRLASVTQGARTQTVSYDLAGRFETSTDEEQRTTQFGYDAVGRLVQVSPPGQQPLTFGHDKVGNTTSAVVAGDMSYGYLYTPDGLLAEFTPPALLEVPQVKTEYAYDVDRAPLQMTLPDGRLVSMVTDPAGRLSELRFPSGRRIFSYDNEGRTASVTTEAGSIIAYGYDGALPVSETWTGPVSGVLTRTWDNDFNEVAVAVNGTSTSLAYDEDGLLIAAGDMTLSRDAASGAVVGTSLGVVTTQPSYDEYGLLAGVEVRVSGTRLYAYSLTRDATGTISGKHEWIAGEASELVYGFDVANRLVSVERDGTVEASWEYDAGGNRVAAIDPSGSRAATFDAQGRMLTDGEASFTYGANGELETQTEGEGTTRFSHDAIGNLVSVTKPDGTLVEYVLDGRERRIAKKVNGTFVQRLLWDGRLRPVAEVDASGATVSRFVYAQGVNVPEYIEKNGQRYWLVRDYLGSVRLVVDVQSGAVVQRMDYDAWGVVTADTNPGFQPFGFAGGLWDPEVGLVRFGARYYDPVRGRWLRPEPLLRAATAVQTSAMAGAPLGVYAYADSNPVARVDPNGDLSVLVAAVPVAVAVVVISEWLIMDQYKHEADVGTRGLPGFHNGPRDAVKHCDASCEVARGEGIWVSALAGWWGEVAGDFRGQPQDEHDMDTHNNACGRQFSTNPDRSCLEQCIDAVFSRQLKVLPSARWDH